jgi:rod shape-determining protein MreD
MGLGREKSEGFGMKKQIVWPYFLISLISTLFFPIPLLFFAPFYATLYLRKSFLSSIWISAGCGMLLDTLSTTPFGTQALIATTITFFLYKYRIYFIEKALGLFTYSLIISLATTLLTRLSLLIVDPSFPFTLKGFITDFIALPLGDGAFSLVFFYYPLILYSFLKKLYFRFLFLKKESRKKKEETIHGT